MLFKTTKGTNWKGIGKLSLSYFKFVRNNAKQRNILFDINIDQCWCIYLEQAGKCAVTGEILVFDEAGKIRNHGNQTASLDRIDNKKGYVVENIRWVHKKVNMSRNKLSNEKFLEYCKLVANKLV